MAAEMSTAEASEHTSKLEGFFQSAQDALDGAANISECEPAFVRLVEFVKQHPAVEPIAIDRLVDGLRFGTISIEVIEFCAHAWRFPAVRAEAMRLLDERSRQGDTSLAGVVAAFGDSWADASFYPYFTR